MNNPMNTEITEAEERYAAEVEVARDTTLSR